MQQQLETTLAQLVAVASVSTSAESCHEAIEFVKNELAPLSLFIHSDTNLPNPWLIATTQDTKTPDILLAAHLDVVPAPNELFFMKKEGDKLLGRGVYDMKFAATCYIELFKAHINELRQRNVGMLLTTDEELGGHTVPNILETGWRTKVVFIPDAGDNWQIEKRAKGFYNFELKTFGKATHGSRPWEGDNAIHRLEDALRILKKAYPYSPAPADTTLSVTMFEGGEAINQIPAYASAKVDFRTFRVADITALKELLEELKTSHKLEITPVSFGPPIAFTANAPEVASFLETLKEITGKQASFTESYGGTDARYFVPYGIPYIAIEPLGGERHSNAEWVNAVDLERYYQLIKNWVLKLPVTANYLD